MNKDLKISFLIEDASHHTTPAPKKYYWSLDTEEPEDFQIACGYTATHEEAYKDAAAALIEKAPFADRVFDE